MRVESLGRGEESPGKKVGFPKQELLGGGDTLFGGEDRRRGKIVLHPRYDLAGPVGIARYPAARLSLIGGGRLAKQEREIRIHDVGEIGLLRRSNRIGRSGFHDFAEVP